jgi:hypothetical protein
LIAINVVVERTVFFFFALTNSPEDILLLQPASVQQTLTMGNAQGQSGKLPPLSLTDSTFASQVRNYPDLWNCLFEENRILLCPISKSLGTDDFNKKMIMSHILEPDRIGGEYKTLRNERVSMEGTELVCGAGFVEPRRVKVQNVEQVEDPVTNISFVVFIISRPLSGGLLAPEEADHMTIQMMFKYMAFIRSFPDAEVILAELDAFLKNVNFVGMQHVDNLSRITPSLRHSLHSHWSKVVTRLSRCGGAGGIGSMGFGSDSTSSLLFLSQVIESYMMHTIGGVVMQWMNSVCSNISHNVRNAIQRLKLLTIADYGIHPEFQCYFADAISLLCAVSHVYTPSEKMIALQAVVTSVRSTIDKNAASNFPNLEPELATDDLVMILVYIIVQAYPEYRDIVSDVRYATEFHFLSSAKSQLGYTLCHFQVAMTWLETYHAECTRKDHLIREMISTHQSSSGNGSGNGISHFTSPQLKHVAHASVCATVAAQTTQTPPRQQQHNGQVSNPPNLRPTHSNGSMNDSSSNASAASAGSSHASSGVFVTNNSNSRIHSTPTNNIDGVFNQQTRETLRTINSQTRSRSGSGSNSARAVDAVLQAHSNTTPSNFYYVDSATNGDPNAGAVLTPQATTLAYADTSSAYAYSFEQPLSPDSTQSLDDLADDSETALTRSGVPYYSMIEIALYENERYAQLHHHQLQQQSPQCLDYDDVSLGPYYNVRIQPEKRAKKQTPKAKPKPKSADKLKKKQHQTLQSDKTAEPPVPTEAPESSASSTYESEIEDFNKSMSVDEGHASRSANKKLFAPRAAKRGTNHDSDSESSLGGNVPLEWTEEERSPAPKITRASPTASKPTARTLSANSNTSSVQSPNQPVFSTMHVIGSTHNTLEIHRHSGSSTNKSSSSSAQSQQLTIVSERTNRKGLISSVYGYDNYYAAINCDGTVPFSFYVLYVAVPNVYFCVFVGNIYTWGQPELGRLGHGQTVEIDHGFTLHMPKRVQCFGQGIKFIMLACGKNHMLALSESRCVFAWGDNRYAQLGFIDVHGHNADHASTPTNSGSISSSMSGRHGSDVNLNPHYTSNLLMMMHARAGTPLMVETLKYVRAESIACGAYHSLCVSTDGSAVYSWGRAAHGRLGTRAGYVVCTNDKNHKESSSSSSSSGGSGAGGAGVFDVPGVCLPTLIKCSWRADDHGVSSLGVEHSQLPRSPSSHSSDVTSSRASLSTLVQADKFLCAHTPMATAVRAHASIHGSSSSSSATGADAQTVKIVSLEPLLAPEQLSNRYILDNVVRDSYVDKQGNKHANSKAQNHINMDEDELHEQLNRLSIEEEDAIVIDNTHLLEALDRPSLESSDYGHSRSNTESADTQHTRATSLTQSNSTPASHQHPTAASTQPTTQTRSPREDGGADTPTQSRIVKIVCGHSHSIAITEFGDVFTWGKGSYGRLGHGSHCDEFVPRRVAALSSGSVYYRITSAAAGMAHTLFLTDTGILYGCGLNASGQLGVVTTTSKPQMGDNDIAESSGAGNEVDVCANGDGVSLKLRRILNVPELTTSVDRCTLL